MAGVSIKSCCEFEVRGTSSEHMHLDSSSWRRHKDGYVRRIPSTFHNGIAVARVSSSSMLSNTCCTALLLQGAPVCADASPP
jgi:hypothetical protein